MVYRLHVRKASAKGQGDRAYLVNVVVNVLASNRRCDGVAFTDAAFGAGVLELQTLLLKTGLDGGIVTVVLLALLNGSHLVDVLLWENFTVLDGLHRGVVVVLVDLTVDGGSSLLMAVLGDALVDYGRGDLLVNGGVIVTGLAPIDCYVSIDCGDGANMNVVIGCWE